MTTASATLPAALAPRVLATPYARRLARERTVPLSAVIGSGPNGRITADDVAAYKPSATPAQLVEIQPPAAETRIAHSAAPPSAPRSVPAAIVVRTECAAVEALLARIAEVRPEVTREDIYLKAAAFVLQASPSLEPKGTLTLLAGNQRRLLNGLADASLSAIAAMRSGTPSAGTPRPGTPGAGTREEGTAALAISFIGKPGVHPVAAQLIGGAAARLVVAASDKDGTVDCLLSYDPEKVSDEDAETCLAIFRDLVEAPFRLLV